jgi:hypothetical protein
MFVSGSASFNTALKCPAGYYCPDDIPNPVRARGHDNAMKNPNPSVTETESAADMIALAASGG